MSWSRVIELVQDSHAYPPGETPTYLQYNGSLQGNKKEKPNLSSCPSQGSLGRTGVLVFFGKWKGSLVNRTQIVSKASLTVEGRVINMHMFSFWDLLLLKMYLNLPGCSLHTEVDFRFDCNIISALGSLLKNDWNHAYTLISFSWRPGADLQGYHNFTCNNQ